MLGSIFYATGLLILVVLTSQILKFRKTQTTKEWFIKYKKFTGNTPKEENFRSNDEWKLYQSSQILFAVEHFWIILGFLSSNWFIFLTLLIYTSFIRWSIKSFQHTIVGKFLELHSMIIRLLTIFFLIINHFHLHLDTKSITLELISMITF
jgi:hypothetical protein